MTPVSLAADRSLLVPRGHLVRTGYVGVFSVRLACRDRMAVGDIDRAYQKRIQLGEAQSWPPPTGYWDGEIFVIEDGRHEWVAAVMIGIEKLLVAWIEAP